MHRQFCLGAATFWALCAGFPQTPETLPGTSPLTMQGDLSAQMRAGFDKFLMREIDRSIETRQSFWKRDFSSPSAYEASVEANRARFRRYIGAVDARLTVTGMEYVSDTHAPAKITETPRYSVFAVRWPVLENVFGEGLLLQPHGEPVARVVAIPEADETPEMLAGLAPGIASPSQFARTLAESGCQVVVPVLIDRKDTLSGNPRIWMTNQPHREWIYRQAFEMGRHIIGYEVQKVLAAVDWFVRDGGSVKPKIAVAGHGEGGLIAFYSAALDTRIDATLVSGYFDSRQRVWEEPIYRNVRGLLHEFGDAEIASLIAPRKLIVEYSEAPSITGPPAARDGRREVAAPGVVRTPSFATVSTEVERARKLFSPGGSFLEFVTGPDGKVTGPGSQRALTGLLGAPSKDTGTVPQDLRKNFDPAARQHRQVTQLVEYTQMLLRLSHHVREQFWNKAKTTSVQDWQATTSEYRNYLWDELIGRFPNNSMPLNVRTRKIYDRPKWVGYEVVLDVWPDVFAWGYLLVPKDIRPGERRPVVVCQHGLEGQPADVVTEDPETPAFKVYNGFAAKLADRGFVTYAPHNFYRGGNAFRVLQRKAHALKKTMFAITVVQHDRVLDWLTTLPFADPGRIGFYGLSYGGATAVRVPAVLERYAVVIASGDFNEWIKKNVTVDDVYSMIFYNVWEVFEFNLGNTFNHSDLAGLIAPRPFMVERGHRDTVAPDEWVAHEYARVRRLYDFLGIPDRTRIEFFNGPHKIHGVGTFEFLQKHLNWGER